MLGKKVAEMTAVTSNKMLPSNNGQPRFETSCEGTGTMLGVEGQFMATYWAQINPDGSVYGECPDSGVVLTAEGPVNVGTNMTETDHGWVPTFPNARYVVSKADWTLFGSRVNTRPFAYLKEQIQPLIDADVLDLIEGEINITDEITTLPTPGHTPGHTSLLISSAGEKAVIVGDAAHVPPQIEETHWSPAPDRDKDKSSESRSMMMDLIEKEHALVASGHFPSPGFGNIVRVNSRRKFIPVS